MQNKNITVIKSLNDQLLIQLTQLQLKYSKLLPIRVDLFYEQGMEGGCYFDLAKSDIENLLSKLELDEQFNIVGYAVVAEYNQKEQIHFHCLFYVDGQKRKKYYPIYLWIAGLWTEISGSTRIHDCQRGQYQIQALKMINYYDQNDFDKLTYAISYLAKEEQKSLFKHNWLDSLFISKAPIPSFRGRPRRYLCSRFK